MKKINNLVSLLAVLAMFATSCGKDGAVGPSGSTGPTGATGAIGPAGPTGANGKDGSMIYAGTAAPAASLGAAGDYYLNKSNDLLYGPKTAAGWGTGVSLKGATGATGASGNTVLNGTGIPNAGLGKNGDYYLDKSTYLLYGPKADAGWGPATSLVGPTGPAGAAGTANVKYSGWNYATNFRDTTFDGSKIKAGDLAAPALTTSVLNSGLVQVYFDYGGGVFAMPYTSFAGGKENTISYLPRLGHFIITRFTGDNSGLIPLSVSIQYRYIIIPGGSALAAAKAKHVNLNDYDAVKAYFNIKN